MRARLAFGARAGTSHRARGARDGGGTANRSIAARLRWIHLLGSSEDWSFQTASDAALAARQLTWPRGRGLGGSSRINAMIWFPPTPADLHGLVRASGGRWSDAALRTAYESIAAVARPEAPVWLSETSRLFLASAQELEGAEPMLYQRLNRGGRRWLPSEWLPTDNERLMIVRGTVDRVVWNDDAALGVRIHGEQVHLNCMPSAVSCSPRERLRPPPF